MTINGEPPFDWANFVMHIWQPGLVHKKKTINKDLAL